MIIDSTAVETVGGQRDSSKRVRDARLHKNLGGEGYKIYSNSDNDKVVALGLPRLRRGEFIAVKI